MPAEQKKHSEFARVGGFGRAQMLFVAFALAAWVVHGMQVMQIVFITNEAAQSFQEEPYLVKVNASFFFAGWILGLTLWGWMAARKGWLAALIAIETCVCVFGIASATAPNGIFFVTARFLCGFAEGGVPTISFGWVSELVPPHLKPRIGTILQFGFMAGSLLIDASSYMLPGNWRIVSAIPALSCLPVLIGAFFLPESPRWLSRVGRSDESKLVMKKIAQWNGVSWLHDPDAHELDHALQANTKGSLPTEEDVHTPLQFHNSNDLGGSISPAEEDGPPPPQRQKTAGSVADLFLSDSSVLLISSIMALHWITFSTGFFTFSLSTSDLPGGEHHNMLLNLMFQTPGLAITVFTLERAGRRLTMLSIFSIMSLTCLALAYTVYHSALSSEYKVALSTLGYVTSACGFSGGYVYTAELFPTDFRSVGLSLSSQAARVGASLSPLILLLHDASPVSPFLFMCGLAGASCASCCLLPETLHEPSLESAHDLRALRSRASWTFLSHVWVKKIDKASI